MRSAPRPRFVSPGRSRAKAGFTLVEIMVAAFITVGLVAILLRITTLASTTITMSTQSISAFASARSAFDTMTRNLSQATLNTYLDYYDSSGNRRTNTSASAGTFAPASYGRASDLQFLIQKNQQCTDARYGQEVYFQAPRSYAVDGNFQSVQGLLNACSYYVRFDDNALYQPSLITTNKYRYRLMQGLEPTEYLQIFVATALSGSGTTTDQSNTWIANIKNGAGTGSEYITPLADNVIALVIWPKLSGTDQAANPSVVLSTDYTYDSQKNVAPTTSRASRGAYTQSNTADLLPPNVEITMVVLDEASAARMAASMTAPGSTAASSVPPTTIESALSGKFSNPTNYATDMTNLANSLSAAHLNFQFFDTTVTMRESKWSIQEQ